jgi:hypothetical protein
MFERSATAQEERLAAARAALGEVQARIGAAREGGERAPLPLAASVAELLPGGLRRGTVLSVSGSTSLVLALAGEASREGSWVAIVGMPHVGLVAAARRGVDLARLALVPHPGAQAATAAAACIDGMDLVILGPRLALSDADRRRLAARARERGSVLLSAGVAGVAWPGARIEMAVEFAQWSGLGAGDGRLRDREVVVAVRERGGPVRRVPVLLDGERGVWRPGVRGAGLADGAVLADEVA